MQQRPSCMPYTYTVHTSPPVDITYRHMYLLTGSPPGRQRQCLRLLHYLRTLLSSKPGDTSLSYVLIKTLMMRTASRAYISGLWRLFIFCLVNDEDSRVYRAYSSHPLLSKEWPIAFLHRPRPHLHCPNFFSQDCYSAVTFWHGVTLCGACGAHVQRHL